MSCTLCDVPHGTRMLYTLRSVQQRPASRPIFLVQELVRLVPADVDDSMFCRFYSGCQRQMSVESLRLLVVHIHLIKDVVDPCSNSDARASEICPDHLRCLLPYISVFLDIACGSLKFPLISVLG